MAANERLRAALMRARKTVDDVARAAGVDPKTVYRWLSNADRVPHPRQRFAVAKLTGEDEEWLWPAAAGRVRVVEPSRAGEIVASYPYRSKVPSDLWWELIGRATEHVDLLGYTLYFLGLQHPELTDALRTKCAAGCRVRTAIGHPDSQHVAYRDEEEGTPLTLVVRIRTTLVTWRDLLTCPGFELRYQDVPLYNSIFRFDDEMFITPHLYATVGSQAPLLHLRRLGPGGLFDRFMSHFEGIWAASTPHPADGEAGSANSLGST